MQSICRLKEIEWVLSWTSAKHPGVRQRGRAVNKGLLLGDVFSTLNIQKCIYRSSPFLLRFTISFLVITIVFISNKTTGLKRTTARVVSLMRRSTPRSHVVEKLVGWFSFSSWVKRCCSLQVHVYRIASISLSLTLNVDCFSYPSIRW